MAGIDKIYGTLAQKTEFIYWLINNKHKALYDVFDYIYSDDMQNSEEQRVIGNFPARIDMWLLKHCPLPFIVDRIKEQYGKEGKE